MTPDLASQPILGLLGATLDPALLFAAGLALALGLHLLEHRPRGGVACLLVGVALWAGGTG